MLDFFGRVGEFLAGGPVHLAARQAPTAHQRGAVGLRPQGPHPGGQARSRPDVGQGALRPLRPESEPRRQRARPALLPLQTPREGLQATRPVEQGPAAGRCAWSCCSTRRCETPSGNRFVRNRPSCCRSITRDSTATTCWPPNKLASPPRSNTSPTTPRRSAPQRCSPSS